MKAYCVKLCHVVCSCCRTPQMKSWSWPPLHYAIYCWSSHPAKRYRFTQTQHCKENRLYDFNVETICFCLSAAHLGVRGDWITMQSDPEWQSCTEGQWDLGPDGKKISSHFLHLSASLQPSKSWEVDWICAFQNCKCLDLMKHLFFSFSLKPLITMTCSHSDCQIISV